MWMMLQQDEPEDYVVATGEEHSVREFVEAAFGHVGLDHEQYVKTDPSSSARPRSTIWSATPRRPARSSAGSGACRSGSSSS